MSIIFLLHYAKDDVTEDPASLRSYYSLLALYCLQIPDASSCLRLIYFVYHVCIVFLSKHYCIRFGTVFFSFFLLSTSFNIGIQISTDEFVLPAAFCTKQIQRKTKLQAKVKKGDFMFVFLSIYLRKTNSFS